MSLDNLVGAVQMDPTNVVVGCKMHELFIHIVALTFPYLWLYAGKERKSRFPLHMLYVI